MNDNVATFSDADLAEAARLPALGPHYFDARRVSESFMAKFESEQFKPLIDKIAEAINERLWNDLHSSLLSDTEMNLQGEIWRMVDSCVMALLGGEQWALQRFVLGKKYDCEKIRETIARHLPTELQDARIADLETELARLKDDNERLRRRSY